LLVSSNIPGHPHETDWKFKYLGDQVWEYERTIEPPTMRDVLTSMHLQHGQANTNLTLEIPTIPWPQNGRYNGNAELHKAYLSAFRDGYYAALAAKGEGILMFGPNEEGIARDIGYHEGQRAGDQTREAIRNKLEK
jgi:hypothetical protein